ncbi:MAG: Fic family protein [Fimbriimonas sp.]
MGEQVEIWDKETGILDLPGGWPEMGSPELRRIEREWPAKRAAYSGALSVFTEQLHREWAIETGVIEDLYDIERGVTQTLIEQGFSDSILSPGSTNRDPSFVLNLLNDQKSALEGLFDFVANRRPLSTSYIKELHAAMTRSQATVTSRDLAGNLVESPMLHGEWKRLPNYPRRNGTQFIYAPPEHTASEMERLVAMHLDHKEVPAEVASAWLHHRFTQIHPFQDGNGRVARALASLVLIRAGLFPLIVPRDEKRIYLDTLERADAGDLQPLVLLIARRTQAAYRRATDVLERIT